MPQYKVKYEIIGKNRTRCGECVGEYNEADAEALAGVFGDSIENGLPVGKVQIVGLEVMEAVVREVSET